MARGGEVMKNLLIVIFSLWQFSLALGQPNHVRFFSLQDGLTNQQVLDVVHDEDGYLWVATELGLNRFAGKAFKSYYASDNQDGRSINSNEINTLLYDDQKIYIGTRSNGLNVLDLHTNKFSYYLHDPADPKSIATNDITDIIKSKNGNLWIATYHQGLQHFDPIKKEFRRYNRKNFPKLPENSIWSLVEDKKNTLYIGHVNKGLSILDPTTGVLKHLTSQNTANQLADNEVKILYCDRYDNIWIGTRKGLSIYHPLTGHIQHIPLAKLAKNGREPFIYTIKEIGDEIWIGGESSQLFIVQPTYRVDKQVAGMKHLQLFDVGKGNNVMIQHISSDRFGNIWLGLYGGGLGFVSHLAPFFYVFPDRSTSTPIATVSSIVERNEQTMFLSTEGTGLVQMDKKGKLLSHIGQKNGDPDDYILTSFKDHNQNIWIGIRRGGVAVQRPNTNTWHEIDLGEQATDVRAILEDHHGHIWIAALQGIFIYNPHRSTVEKLLINKPMMGDYAPRALVEDDRGNMWVGTYGQGLYIFDSNRKLLQNITNHTGLRSNTVNDLLRDKHHNIWVATNSGIVFQHAQKEIGKLDILTPPGADAWLFINAIAEDQHGNIWCSTKSGLMRYLPLEKQFLQYDQAFGLPLGGFINGSVGQDHNGHLYFGMQEGISYFDPKDIPLSLPTSPVRISRFIVFRSGESNTTVDKYPSQQQEINLSHEENSFRVELAVMDFALHGLVEFSYQLQGLNNDWIFLGNETNLDFRNIPYGEHELIIRTRMRNGQWSNDYQRLLVKIAPPIYLSLPAKILYFGILASILYVLIFFYNKKLKAESELKLKERQHEQDQKLYTERINFYTHITHELRTPLTLILGPLDDLADEKQLSAKNKGLVLAVQKSANRLFTLVNQLLEFRKIESQYKPLVLGEGYLAEMLHELVEKYKLLNSKKDLQVISRLPDPDIRTLFDAEIVQLIVENLLSNAYKYSEKGNIEVSLHYEKNQLVNWAVLTVSDTGCGISAKNIDSIFDKFYQVSRPGVQGTGIGLAMVKELIAIHQGKINVDSTEGVGTTFTVRFLANHVIVEKEEEPTANWDQENVEIESVRPLLLLVEDDPDLRDYLGDILQTHYEVLRAENGLSGFKIAKEQVPDLLISDIMMPDMDGFQLAEKLKEDRVTSHIPLILLTAKDTDLDRQRGYDLGIDSYLTKPIGRTLLFKRIDNLLRKQKNMYATILQKIKADTFESQPSEQAMPKEDLWRENIFVQDFAKIVEQHMQDEVLDATTLAERMNMSQSTLYRKLKGITGKNINQLVRKIRIHKAAELLLSGHYNVTEVSFMVGINSAIYFRQCFKEEFGKLPSEYQKSTINSKKA